MNSMEFKECDSCSKKSGSPILCKSCINNRDYISHLEDKLNKALRFRSLLKEMITLFDK